MNLHSIATVQDAIAFLEEQCQCIVVPTEDVPGFWKVVSVTGELHEILTDNELLGFARMRAGQTRLRRSLGGGAERGAACEESLTVEQCAGNEGMREGGAA